MSIYERLILAWASNKRKITDLLRSLSLARSHDDPGAQAVDWEGSQCDEQWDSDDTQRDLDTESDPKQLWQPQSQHSGWGDPSDEAEAWKAERGKQINEKWVRAPVIVPPTWAAPLPALSDIAKSDLIVVDGEVCVFLSQFLSERRVGGVSFKERHGLLVLLLRLVTASIHDAVQRLDPVKLILLRVQGPDQLELKWWLDLLGDLDPGWLNPQHSEPFDWELLRDCRWRIENLRHDAVHRRPYDTYLVKNAVNFLIALKDLERFRQVERTIRTLYSTLSGDLVVSEQENLAMKKALAFYPEECRTKYDLFYTISGVLENYKDEVSVAEEWELYRPIGVDRSWNSPFSTYRCSNLRNMVAHRGSEISDPSTDLEKVLSMVEFYKVIAAEEGDEGAAAEIERISQAALPHIQVRSERCKAFLRSLNAHPMSQQASHWHRKRTRLLDWGEGELLADRYDEASLIFRNLAGVRDGSTYRGNLRFLQSQANEAHEEWLKAQSHNFSMMTPQGRLRFAQSQANQAHEKWLSAQRRKHGLLNWCGHGSSW
ncbi:hypothetical protein G7Y79_00010g029270 [Physcia stellaris]|nr:hypothetical protein G7Y79_00010g029270 [Physcia stellaris]